jgi:ATP-binding cassette subfamily B protein
LLIAGWLVWSMVGTATDVGGLLLLVYWVLNLPVLGQEAANALWQYPMLRNTTLRLLEPLGAREDADAAPATNTAANGAAALDAGNPEAAPALRWETVTVRAGGHVILDRVELTVSPASHVGIVGVSGAGKSSLIGLLLGWQKPSEGSVLVDGQALGSGTLDRLRAATAWVDPQVQIWNRSLYENIRYGGPGDAAMDDVLRAAEMMGVVQRLPAGLQTVLGEGGGLVSGGEGQRVRLARGLARADVRLAVLDEPARGLDRASRREMVRRARERWRDATLLCITHDVSDTRDFDRVLVIDGGRVVEDGPPSALAANPDSLYRKMLDAEAALHRELWASPRWRHLRLNEGRLEEGRMEQDGAHAPLASNPASLHPAADTVVVAPNGLGGRVNPASLDARTPSQSSRPENRALRDEAPGNDKSTAPS